MQLALSIVICAHNPRLNYLERVLEALKSQTLSQDFWELLLVDNASDKILAAEIDLSWHPQGRHIREEQLGLTAARLRGIREATAGVIVFVDDDNVLDSDYLETTWRISKDFPFIGAWGGQIKAEFEEPPPSWTKPYLGNLAIREFERDRWSNLIDQYETTPCGAGLCIRKVVGEKYTELVRNNPQRAGMDRKGKMLTSCGDSDLAFTACDIGLGTGLFTSLKLTHLIPANRLKEDYLLRLVEGLAYSQIMLAYFRGTISPQSFWRSSNIYSLYLGIRYGLRVFRFHEAAQKGRRLALKEIGN
ncbi:MAG: glycosyltransferase [Nostoc sp. ZfuVER08]|jgi:glycosyltransferase involved in cell wall biosynthesis|uniref:Glycosyltransferase family 2 protein n=1 Tax=Nostoc punctiforme FACHB-252 TaxID=1357509 RepID=A0ABR8H1Y1_NOSPU|nr:glycosyltransferase [Nostoc punctiforme]MBD2609693.1 glycosyltransferase family 2 protein [Nostoc punctiforme FACHB-252]MDZ8012894.1 glycosyltransferase [Nostoc sp. ZfuVER08]